MVDGGVAGGVTTILDFGLQDQGGSLVEARDRRLDVIRPDAIIDYGFHLIVTDVNDASLEEIAALQRRACSEVSESSTREAALREHAAALERRLSEAEAEKAAAAAALLKRKRLATSEKEARQQAAAEHFFRQCWR